MTVRTGVVTQPSETSAAARVLRWVVARPLVLSRSLRLAVTVTSGRAGESLTFQPQCRAAVRCDTTPVIRLAATWASAASASA